MVSQKQLLANRKNALQSTGPRTPEGKARAARNSLKHGLLAKEVVITEGEGAEDPQAFTALLEDLLEQFQPIGSLEEILVEKIAVCYWRLRRAQRYEVGVLRQRLDMGSDDYYDQEGNPTNDQIHEQILLLLEYCKDAGRDFTKLSELHAKGTSLEEIFNDKVVWERLYRCCLNPSSDGPVPSPQHMIDILRMDVSDDEIWKTLGIVCKLYLRDTSLKIKKLIRDKARNRFRLSALKKQYALPPRQEMDNLLRYETSIERQLYKAINQLERLQRQRAGDYVPAPVTVEVNLQEKTGT
ncbi:MAG: hypothetical protein JW828_04230 [Sedimentisphaerales bacterium]|nr:hypothetical protein [Sedimentisphaerales bacterium]